MSSAIERFFSLSMPWWEFIARAVVVYLAVLLLIRLTSKRTLGQATSFDLLLIVLLGNSVQNALLGDDISLGGGLILAATLLLLNALTGRLSSYSPRLDKLLEGEPVILASNGVLFSGNGSRPRPSARTSSTAPAAKPALQPWPRYAWLCWKPPDTSPFWTPGSNASACGHGRCSALSLQAPACARPGRRMPDPAQARPHRPKGATGHGHVAQGEGRRNLKTLSRSQKPA